MASYQTSKPSHHQPKRRGITATTKAKAAAYQYRPLDPERKEIRLLTVHAASKSPTGTVRCTMKHASLAQEPKPEYETISYCWGSTEERWDIIVDEKIIDTVASAERALRRMRHPHKDRVMWIDAVCINQNDRQERGHQVAMMAGIYENTFRNLVWLGESDGSTSEALGAIAAILDDVRRETEDFSRFYDTLWSSNSAFQYSSTGLSFDLDWEPLRRLYRTPWFSRLWVVQEAALAPVSLCYCGHYEVALLDMLRVADWIQHKHHFMELSILQTTFTARIMSGFVDHEHGLYGRRSGVNIYCLDLLTSLQDCEASDPRDHVYGLLGLYQKSRPRGELSALLAPDYTKSLADVLRDATRFAMVERSDVACFRDLSHWPLRSAEDGQFPTWVPRWDRKWDQNIDPRHLNNIFRADDPYTETSLAETNATDLNVLSLKGMIIAVVEQTWASVMPGMTVSELLDILENIQRALQSIPFPQRDPTVAIAKTLIAGADHHEQPASLEWATHGHVAWSKSIREPKMFPPALNSVQFYLQEGDTELQQASEYTKACVNACASRRLFISKYGLLGLGPQTMQPNDIITILYGCMWPVILRPRPQSDEYEMVGVSYVYGIMDGEAVEENEEKGIEDMTFHIR